MFQIDWEELSPASLFILIPAGITVWCAVFLVLAFVCAGLKMLILGH